MDYDRRKQAVEENPIRALLDAGLGRVPGDLLSMVGWTEKAQDEIRVKLKNNRGEIESEVKTGLSALDALFRDPSLDDDLKVKLIPVKFALSRCLDAAKLSESSANAVMVHLLHTFSGAARTAKEAVKAVQQAYRR